MDFDIVDLSDEQKDKAERGLAKFFFWFGLAGLVICGVLWLLNLISDRAMLGITLALSWLAVMIPGFNAMVLKRNL